MFTIAQFSDSVFCFKRNYIWQNLSANVEKYYVIGVVHTKYETRKYSSKVIYKYKMSKAVGTMFRMFE